MKIDVLLFGVLKDVVGRSAEALDLPDGARVREILLHYALATPQFRAMAPSLAVSVNREYAEMDQLLHEGDEVGLLPPVSGGSSGNDNDNDNDNHSDSDNDNDHADAAPEVRIVRQPIDAEAVLARLKRPSDGALVIFDGIVRDNTRARRTLYLDYEAYEAMALTQMKSLATNAATRFAIRGAAIVHRLGRLQIGETSVLIAVAGPHRGPAFDACRWIIDTLKKTVPIWKKEYFEDGAVWADGEPFPQEIRSPSGTAGRKRASK